MGSPGIDKWIQEAPESWAKLAKTKNKKLTYNNWKKKFYDGAELQNKTYLKKYLTETQLKNIYENGYHPTQKNTGYTITPTQKKELITVTRNNKQYQKTPTPRWGIETQYVLKLATKTKPKTPEYEKYVNILINQGRTRQAVIKKIQRTRKDKQWK